MRVIIGVALLLVGLVSADGEVQTMEGDVSSCRANGLTDFVSSQ